MMWKWVDLLLWRLLAGCVVLASSIAYVAHANYSVTPSVGNTYTFGSITVSGVQYPSQMICDFATGNAQCMTVDSSGNAHAGIWQGANQAGVDSSNNLHAGVWSGSNQAGVVAGNAAATTDKSLEVADANVLAAVQATGNIQGTGVAGTAATGVVTTQGIAGMTPVLSQMQAIASGGWTYKTFIAGASDNATNLKASAGVVHAVQVFGIGATPAYLKFYDMASTPTCGSSTVVKELIIPAGSAASVATVLDAQFTTGISYCVTTGIAVNDDTSPAAATYAVNIDYK